MTLTELIAISHKEGDFYVPNDKVSIGDAVIQKFNERYAGVKFNGAGATVNFPWEDIGLEESDVTVRSNTAQFKTITEAVLRNSTRDVLHRVEMVDSSAAALIEICNCGGLAVGDTITIEERETEVV